MPDISIPHMAMLVLLSHFRDIDGLIGEVETCSKLLQLWPTQEQREKREKNQNKRAKKADEERERDREGDEKHKYSESLL